MLIPEGVLTGVWSLNGGTNTWLAPAVGSCISINLAQN
ncbi:hypothetical protein MC7420_4194 [Coleofasciculus chthonoplastes PCC 7420]|uniref:Uncharacterized protein n=1 Tax=Coleofasciculus chthonoplastes PCC 7420 TaxID=118168 RepID=B4VVH0_9CYAN|nr:hypothetical protein MC7420_4194 [Coleofasciculus chthonoplastes PCC 7420]